MIVLDLHTGEELELPPRVVPGRYRLLAPVTLNAAVELKAGDMLWSDGGTRCDLHDEQGNTWRSMFEPIPSDQADAWQLVDQGVLTVAKLVGNAINDLPAPLMPNSLTDFAKASGFEEKLQQVLATGHLHEISERPRMSMRYDATMLPVSRTRRLASGALERLASRSEDWHRRTLSGVEPARVLAEVSEDEWGIYENIVFARLLDQALRLIGRRERALALLIERQSSALKLSQAEDLNYRLREKLCHLWGQAWEAKPQSEDDPLHIRLKALQEMGGRLRQLRFGALYQAIPHSARVPIALKNTNVLTHDPHYREVRGLWQLAHQGELGVQVKPEEKIRQRLAQHQNYATFVGLLIRHALQACLTLTPTGRTDEWNFAGGRLQLEKLQSCEWQLRLVWPGNAMIGANSLTFVAAWIGCSNWQENVGCEDFQHQRQIVYCHPTQAKDQPTESGEDGVLNPLQFYAVERIKQRVEGWLYWHALRSYPVCIDTMQTDLRDLLCSKASHAFVANRNGLRVVGWTSSLDAIGLARARGANAATLDQLKWGRELVAMLGTCRACGQSPAKLKTDPQKLTFWASCGCGYEWGTRFTSSHREMVFRFQSLTNDGADPCFRRNGALVMRQRLD